MVRTWMLLVAATSLVGCQSQNPYAWFGPHRVPTPGQPTPAPYYPATASAATPTRTSISAESPPSAASTTIADAGDKQPIRIVENPAPAARTADAGTTRSAGSNAAPANGSPINLGPPPATNGKSSRASSDPGIQRASYEQPAATTASAGQWKSR